MPFDSGRNEKSKLFSDLIGFEDIERDVRRGSQAWGCSRCPAPERPVPRGAAQARQLRSHWLPAPLTLAGDTWVSGQQTNDTVLIPEKDIGTERKSGKWTQSSERLIRGIQVEGLGVIDYFKGIGVY